MFEVNWRNIPITLTAPALSAKRLIARMVTQKKDDWTIQNFLEGLNQKAKVSGVDGDFACALKWSIQRITGATERTASQLAKNRPPSPSPKTTL